MKTHRKMVIFMADDMLTGMMKRLRLAEIALPHSVSTLK